MKKYLEYWWIVAILAAGIMVNPAMSWGAKVVNKMFIPDDGKYYSMEFARISSSLLNRGSVDRPDYFEEGYDLLYQKLKPVVKYRADSLRFNEWEKFYKKSALEWRVRYENVDRTCVRFVDTNTEVKTLEKCLEQTQDWFWAYYLWKKDRADFRPYLNTPQDFRECYATFKSDSTFSVRVKWALAEKLKSPQFQAEFLLE